MEQDPTWVLTSCGQMKLISRFHGDVNNHNCRIWATSNPRPFFFETRCPVNGWITETTFGEDRIVSRHCGVPMASSVSDLTPVDFWLWGYLKSRVYLSSPSSLSELKDAIRREVTSIHPDMLHSAVAGFVTRLECLLPCGGGHVEHILV
ncbi:uncharacterized protein TNCV_5074871 [Trichonephila clavipes]|nr:uncharacterized protein TNCV_5074871 [Trichonephila clavipes]